MIWFLMRRLLWMIATLWAVFTVSFFLMHAVPGGPFSSERKPPAGIQQAFDRRYNLDLPVAQQYLLELGKYLRRRFRHELSRWPIFR